MHKEISLLQDANLKGKIVLVRVDHNVVKSGLIHDPYRIDATIGTLFHILAKGGKIILMTHVGRPKDKKTGTIKIDEKTSVAPIVKYLEEKLNVAIETPEYQSYGEEGYLIENSCTNYSIKRLKDGEIDIIYLPNTRWFKGEESKGEEQDRFACKLAALADVYVNDAFGSWQANASTVGINKYLPSYAGFLMQKEIKNLDRIFNAELPFLAVVAGSKFDTKIEPLYALLKKVDKLVLGGVIYNAYLCAKYGIKIKGVDDNDIQLAGEFIKFAEQYPNKILELPYIAESDIMEGNEENCKIHDIRNFKVGEELNFVLDAAAESFTEKYVRDAFLSAKTIFVNAVMGYTPYFNKGTIALDTLIDENTEALKLYGGGDTMQELKRLLPGIYMTALDSPKYYIFTGGGAVLKAIEQDSYLGIEPVEKLVVNT